MNPAAPAWRSLPDADVANSGSVRFEALPGARGTLVRVDMQYSPPGHVAGAAVALAVQPVAASANRRRFARA